MQRQTHKQTRREGENSNLQGNEGIGGEEEDDDKIICIASYFLVLTENTRSLFLVNRYVLSLARGR